MKVAFIACEYNPFHNGHKYHIDKTRESGVDAVVCIMSGNFVQRGSIAMLEKHSRAKMALLSGADLVIELPLRYAVATAPLFADGFVKTASLTGLDGLISFGCETDTDRLLELRNLLDKILFEEHSDDMQDKGISYPKALSRYIAKNHGEALSGILDDANNVLALEYLRARKEYFEKAELLSVKRYGASHNSGEAIKGFASASYIRSIFSENQNKESFANNAGTLIPQKAFSVLSDEISSGHFSDEQIFNNVFFSRLIGIKEESLREINNVSGGIENRITESIKTSVSLSEVYDKVKSKRYTHSRIRQIIINAALGIFRSDYESEIGYIRILGCNLKGREVLRVMKNTSRVPVIMNLSQLKSDTAFIKKQLESDFIAGKLFDLCNKLPRGGNPEYDIPPVIID